VKPVFDTNILIDYLNGHPPAAQELARYPAASISPITWIEVLTGAAESEEASVRSFLARFDHIPVSREVAEAALVLRRRSGIRLPDAIIWASARSERTLLITRNTKDFPEHEPDIPAASTGRVTPATRSSASSTPLPPSKASSATDRPDPSEAPSPSPKCHRRKWQIRIRAESPNRFRRLPYALHRKS
jgi:hypothetical protein